jgi:hypothetical protein
MITRNHARYCVSFCLSIPAIPRCCKTRRYWIPPALRPSVLVGMNPALQKYGLTVLGPSHRNLPSSEYFNLFAVSRSSITLRRSKNQSSNFKLTPGSVAFNQTSASTSNFPLHRIFAFVPALRAEETIFIGSCVTHAPGLYPRLDSSQDLPFSAPADPWQVRSIKWLIYFYFYFCELPKAQYQRNLKSIELMPHSRPLKRLGWA